jgi:hypothetical protein
MAADAKGGRKYWEGVVRRWRSSGVSMLAFSRTHQISYTQLVRWRGRIEAGATKQPEVTLIPVSPVSVAMPDRGSGVLVRLGAGVQIEVARGFDAEVLRGVVRVLSGTLPC